MVERQNASRFSRRARELFSKAFILGVDPMHLRAEARKATENVQLKGGERVTRADLSGLRQEVLSVLGISR